MVAISADEYRNHEGRMNSEDEGIHSSLARASQRRTHKRSRTGLRPSLEADVQPVN
jgi:hypothetical protein